MSWQVVATIDEVHAGQPRIVQIQGRQIGVFYEGGRYYAVLNVCPHAGAPVCRGRVVGAVTCDDRGQVDYRSDQPVLRCPWHHWEFDLATGRPLAAIRQRLKTYPVRIEGGRILINVASA